MQNTQRIDAVVAELTKGGWGCTERSATRRSIISRSRSWTAWAALRCGCSGRFGRPRDEPLETRSAR